MVELQSVSVHHTQEKLPKLEINEYKTVETWNNDKYVKVMPVSNLVKLLYYFCSALFILNVIFKRMYITNIGRGHWKWTCKMNIKLVVNLTATSIPMSNIRTQYILGFISLINIISFFTARHLVFIFVRKKYDSYCFKQNCILLWYI